ncbi:hypothetical protein DSO57_1027186 [Entomophthora muscae]|uniref:Uncharacterized protein n=1 Tax=Entomophthora muscae TaxID=34485 RepID=A0ACC2TZS5_9FUNG|nr:hypothetical protein DSO57_1027186 [Entomophthora muscae]
MLLFTLFTLHICLGSKDFIVGHKTHGILPKTSSLVLSKGLAWLGQREFSSEHAWAYNYLQLDDEAILDLFNKDTSRYTITNKTQSYFVERDIVISPHLICLSNYRCKFDSFWTLERGWLPRNLTLETDSPDSITLSTNTTTLTFEATVTGSCQHIVWFKPISWFIEASFKRTILVRRYPEFKYSTESKVFRISLNDQNATNGFFGVRLVNK